MEIDEAQKVVNTAQPGVSLLRVDVLQMLSEFREFGGTEVQRPGEVALQGLQLLQTVGEEPEAQFDQKSLVFHTN